MKNNSKTVLLAIIIILVIIAFWTVGTNNTLVSLSQEVESSQADIETTLQRRNDLIPNLVATVKGYASHEEEVFTEIADARSKLASSIESEDMDAIGEASNSLDSALSRLLAISESYPELRASEQFIALQDELAGTENRITVARQNYNEAVKEYNMAIKRFPNSIAAGMIGFYPKEYFEASEEAEIAPEVDFS